MKKLFFVVMGVAIFAVAHNALALDPDIKFKSGDKNVVLKEVQVEPCPDCARTDKICYQLYVNNEALLIPEVDKLEMGNDYIFCGVGGSDVVYKTDQKDIIVIKTSSADMNLLTTWTFVNLKNSTSFDLVEQGSFTIQNGAKSLTLKGITIADDIKSNKCDDSNVKSSAQASKTRIVVRGFKADGKSVYKPNNSNSLLDCAYTTFHEGGSENGAFVIGIAKNIQGVSRDLNLVYFSGRGKDWTAYYAYNIKLNKITKTTLANINKSKIKLTLVKAF